MSDSNSNRTYSVNDLVKKYFADEKTIRNYIALMAKVFGFDKELLTKLNEKNHKEYVLTSEQEQIIGLILEGREEDPFLKKNTKIEKISETELKLYRERLIERIDEIENVEIRQSIKKSKYYQLGKQLNDIYEEKEQVQDAFLFLIEHIQLEERVEMERKLLETDKKVVKYLMDRFMEGIKEEAYRNLAYEEVIDEDGCIELVEPTEEEIRQRINEVLDEKLQKRELIDNNYAGYNLVEKAIGEVLKNTLGEEKNGN